MNYKIGKIKNNVALPAKFDMMLDNNIMFYVLFRDDNGNEGSVAPVYADVIIQDLITELSCDIGSKVRYDINLHYNGKNEVAISSVILMWNGPNEEIRRKVIEKKISL